MAIVRKITGACPCTKLIQSGDLIVYAPESAWNPLALQDRYLFDCFVSYEDAFKPKLSRPYVVKKSSIDEDIVGPFLVLQQMYTHRMGVPVWLCLYNEKYIWVKVEESHMLGCKNTGMFVYSNVDE